MASIRQRQTMTDEPADGALCRRSSSASRISAAATSFCPRRQGSSIRCWPPEAEPVTTCRPVQTALRARRARNIADGRSLPEPARRARGAAFVATPKRPTSLELRRERAARGRAGGSRPLGRRFRALARELGVWLLAGSCAARDRNGRQPLAALLAGRALAARYDKMHLFDVDLPNGETSRASPAHAVATGMSRPIGPGSASPSATTALPAALTRPWPWPGQPC